MRWLARLRHVLWSARADRADAELDEELRYHLDRQTEANIASGMTPEEARLAALRAFGGVDQRREECRDSRPLALVDSVRQDVKYALRSLRKTPGFAAVAVASLALGIGANTTIFTFVDAVLLRPLPYPDSERLVVLRERPPASDDTVNVHPLNFLEWRARTHAFTKLALVQTIPDNVMTPAGAEQLAEVQTTAELFDAFGVTPVLGRPISVADTRPGAAGVVVLSHAFWQRQFGGDPGVLGRQLLLSDGSRQIVGVAPAGLRVGTVDPDLITPLTIDPADPSAIGGRSFQCYGRLRAGVSLEQARAELAVVATDLGRQYPLDKGYGVFVSTLHDYLVREGRPALRLLMAVVAAVLVVACLNLTGLLMARGMGRRGELALRASLGASRGRILRQLVIESLILSAAGAACGLVLAVFATRTLVALTGGALSVGIVGPIEMNAACLLFTAGISVATTLLFGLLPAWQASHLPPQMALAGRGRGTTVDRKHHRLRRLLVVSEAAAAVVLLVGAGLLLRTFSRLTNVSLGFEPSHTVTMSVFLGDRPEAYRISLLDELLSRIETLPGVTAAGSIQFLPLSGSSCGTGVWIDAQPTGDPSHGLPTNCSLVDGNYFKAMAIPVLEGRVFGTADRQGTRRVVVIDGSFVRRYFPGVDPVGRHVTVAWTDTAPAEVVGVVGDVRHDGLTADPEPTVYLLHRQTPGYITSLVIRADGDAAAQIPAIRQAIRDVDRSQAVSSVKTMDQYLDAALARPRLYAALVAGFAALALTLATLGVYGLLSYVVGQRAHEIGIRLALGADRRRVFREIVVQALALTSAGLATGVAVALALQRLIAGLLFGVDARDPITYGLAAVAFLAAALLATMTPALRASRIDPASALRYD